MRPGAERRFSWPPTRRAPGATRSTTASRHPNSRIAFRRQAKVCCSGKPPPPTPRPAYRAAQPQPAPYRVASLAPTVPYQRPPREDLTTLVSLKSSAFPYFGNNPRTDEPFLNVSKGERRGHRSYSGRVYWQDETYNDNRVLMHVPENFDIRKPGVIVVFFHGNGATLERDVRDRQLVPQQISDSGVNAVLLAPQLAVNAANSSAGKFWQPGGLKRFIDEIGQSSRPPLRRSEGGQGVRQPAGRHRRLQRRLRADRLEPRGRRPRQPRPRRVPARCGLWRAGQVRVLDRATTAPASSSAPIRATPSGTTRN